MQNWANNIADKALTVEYRKIQGIMGDVSFSIVLPKEYATNLGLKKGEFVKVWLVDGKIIIEKADKGRNSIE
jgi:AbrB family looped-hinge helix DNA binding protein